MSEFIQSFNQTLQEMDIAVFEEYKKSLIDLKLEPPHRLSEESEQYWSEIYLGRFQWDRIEKEVELLRSISLAEMQGMFLKECF